MAAGTALHSAPELDAWLEGLGARRFVEALGELEPEAALFVVDGKRRLLHFSSGAEKLLGFSASKVLLEHCLVVNRCQSCRAGCGLAEHRVLDGIALSLYRADGSALRVRKTARAFFDSAGDFAGGVELLRRAAPPAGGAEPAPGVRAFHGLVSRDSAMLSVFDTIVNVAETDATVLVRGESGTGKELVARAIHLESHRRQRPFVPVNCAALTPSLVESELFGHVRGAFTGAARDRRGLFREADGGTVFLDEVAELPLDIQSKLLRVLEEREVTPVGASRALGVDVRVVSATHRSLRDQVKKGRFREDLMYRLRVVPLFVPPLRERRSDVEALLWHFIALRNERGPRRLRDVAPETMRVLLEHPWPGNVRELSNVVEYAFAVGRGERLETSDLPPEFREGTSPGARRVEPEPPVPGESERDQLIRVLERHGGNVGAAARALGMSRPTFWRRRKKYHV